MNLSQSPNRTVNFWLMIAANRIPIWHCLGFILLFLLSQSVLAEAVPINAATRARIAYISNSQKVILNDPKKLAEIVYITKALNNSQTADANNLTKIIVKFEEDWKNQRPAGFMDTFRDELRSVGGLANAASAVIPAGKVAAFLGAAGSTYNIYGQKFEDYLQQRDAAADRVLEGQYWNMARSENGQQAVEEFYDKCRKNGANANICDSIMGQTFQAKVTDSAETICNQNTDLAGCLYLKKETVTIEELKAEFQNQMTEMQRVVTGAVTTIKNIETTTNQTQQTLIAWNKNIVGQQQAQQIVVAKKITFEEKIQFAQGTVSAISGLAGFIEPKLGHQISVVGNAGIQIASSVNNFMDAAAKINTATSVFGKLQGVVGAAGTMLPMVGAVMSVVSMFKPSQPSPDPMIMAELQKIQQQISQLRTEMHDRFDRVDASLNKIMDKMDASFALIDYQLGVINGNVADIQKGLFQLTADLNHVQRSIYTFLDTGFRQDLLLEINGSLGYQQRTKETMPYGDSSRGFIKAENTFQTWSTLFANDPLRAGEFTRDYSSDRILTELDTYPLSFNINYLSNYPSKVLVLSALSSQRLANPIDLAFSANAYAQLMDENPSYASRINPARMTAIQNAIDNVKTALRNIANKDIFNRLFVDYINKVNAMKTALLNSENEYKANPDLKIGGFDLWGAGDQSQVPYYTPNITQVRDCTGAGQPISLPNDWRNVFSVDNAIVNAETLQYTTIDACYESERVDTFDFHHVIFRNQIFQFLRFGKVKIRIKFTFLWNNNNIVITSRVWTSPTNLCLDEHKDNDSIYYWNNPIYYKFLDAWEGTWTGPGYCSTSQLTNIKSSFNTASTVESTIKDSQPAILAEVKKTVADKLVDHQKAVYSKILVELQTVGSVNTAKQRLQGSNLALQSFVALGFPQAFNNNDYIRALLFGNERLPDTDIIAGLYNTALNNLKTGQLPPKVDVVALANERANALQEVLNTTIDMINGQGTENGQSIEEGHVFLEDVQTHLKLSSVYFQLRELTLNKSGTGSGTVSSSPAGIDCGDTCTQLFDVNSVVTLTASAGADSAFTGWSGACTGTASTCQVTMDDAKSVIANFADTKQTLTVVKLGTGYGSVFGGNGFSCGDFVASCNQNFSKNSVVNLTAQAFSGWMFAGWGGACNGMGACQVTMDQAKTVTASFAVPEGPFAYITNGGENTVSVIDMASNTVVTNIPVGNSPYGVAVSSNGLRVYVTNLSEKSVSVINTANNTVVATVTVGFSPWSVAVNHAGTRVYVANSGSNNVSVIDAASNTVIGNVSTDERPMGIVVSPNGNRVYVAHIKNDNTGEVSVIDTINTSIITTIPLRSAAFGIAINPNGSRLYVANVHAGTVSVINTANNSVVDTVTVGTEPYGVAVSPDGKQIYVTNRYSYTVSVIDSITNAIITTVPVGYDPVGIASSVDGKTVYVANAQSNTVSVIDTANNWAVTTIKAGRFATAFGQFIAPPTKIGQTISFGTAPSIKVGSEGVVSATGGASGNPVEFRTQTPTVCTVSGNTVYGNSVGNCTIAANQAGNENFNPAPEVLQTFSVNECSQIINFGPAPTVIVDGTGSVSATTGCATSKPVTFTSVTPNICSADGINGSVVTGIIVGTCTVAASLEGVLFFAPITQSFTIGKGNQTIIFQLPPSVIVGRNVVLSAKGGKSGNPVTFGSLTTGICITSGINGSTVNGVAVGTCTIAANQTGNANYNDAQQVTLSFNVTAGFMLTVNNLNPAGGTVISNPSGIACGATCSANFANGTSVKLTAIPVTGYQFSGWGGACYGYGNSCTLTMDAAKSCAANFEVFKKKRRPSWRGVLSQ